MFLVWSMTGYMLGSKFLLAKCYKIKNISLITNLMMSGAVNGVVVYAKRV